MIELNPLEDADIPSAEREAYECGKASAIAGEDIPSYTEDFDYLDYCFLLGWMDGMIEKQRAEVVEELKELKKKWIEADAYNEGLKDGREDAIEEYRQRVRKVLLMIECMEDAVYIVDDMAEQLKAGAEE